MKESQSGSRDFDFARQLRRAASPGPANLAEGFAYYRHKESAKFVRVAKASLIETDNHLGDGIDRGHWTAERCQSPANSRNAQRELPPSGSST